MPCKSATASHYHRVLPKQTLSALGKHQVTKVARRCLSNGLTHVRQSAFPVGPIASAQLSELPASSSAFAVKPPRPSSCRRYSPGARYREFSHDPSLQPFHSVNSQETKQLAEHQRDLQLQHCPQPHGVLVAFTQDFPKRLEEFRVRPHARRLLSCLRVKVETHRRRIACRGPRTRYARLHRIRNHPPHRRAHGVLQARLDCVLVRDRPLLSPCAQRLRGRVPYHDDVAERAVPSSQKALPYLLQAQRRSRHEVVDRVLHPERIVRRDREPKRHAHHQCPVPYLTNSSR